MSDAEVLIDVFGVTVDGLKQNKKGRLVKSPCYLNVKIHGHLVPAGPEV